MKKRMRGGAKESQRKRGRKRAKVTDGKKDNSVVFVTPPYVELVDWLIGV